ncbi:MAG: amidohydrolase family protein [Planctomycetota bacterium]
MRCKRHRLPVFVVLAFAIAGGTHASQASAEFETPIAVTNVTIATGAGTTIESGIIVMSKGRIVAVGRDVGVPVDAQRIDATGLIAYPGFIDAHTHLGIADTKRSVEERELAEDLNPDPREGPIAATRAANRRGIRPEVRALELYAPDEAQLEAHRAAGFTAALVAPREGLLSGTSDLLSLSGAPKRRSVIAADIAMHGSFAAGEEGEYPKSLMGVFAQFRQVVSDARWYAKTRRHAARRPTTAARVPTDAALDALQPLLARSQRIIFEANSENEIRRALDLTAELNLDVVISGGREAWKVFTPGRIKAERIELIVSLKFDEEPEFGKDRPSNEGGESAVSDADAPTKQFYEPLKLREERRRLWEEQVDNIIRLHEAGIDFSLSTRGFDKPAEFLANLRKVIKRGLPERAAVAALTVAPAELLGLRQQLGAIARGHLANLTLMTKPLSYDDAKAKIVFVDGRKFEIDQEQKANKKKKGDRKPEGETVASDPEDAPAEPAWAVEIKADRTPATRTGGNVLIHNATVIPVSSPAIENASVLVRNGKIEAVGPNLRVPTDVTVIDATGWFVIPGFVDCHSHLGTDGGLNEWSVAVSPEVRVADVIDPHSVAIFRAVAGGTTTHHVLHGSMNPIGGQNAILKLKYGRPASEMLMGDAPRTIKFALGENVVWANMPKHKDKRFPSTRMGVESTIRTAFEAARTYRAKWARYEAESQDGIDVPLVRRDLRLEALADVLAGKLTVHAHCYRSDEILRLITVAEDYGFRIGTLQHVLEGYRVAPEIARHGCGASTFADLWGYKMEAYGAIPHNAALMTQHGIAVSVNSDLPWRIRYLGQEAAKCVRWGGLNEIQALRLATMNPAMQLRIDDRVGSIEVGKDGDLAIFNGHPLNTFSKCVMTLIEGEVYFEDARPEPTAPAGIPPFFSEVDRTIPQTPHRAYAVVNATVHTISGPVIENATVVIVEDRIAAVGADVAVPPGAGVIDGAGLHVYPGLIDAGGVLGLVEINVLRATRDSSEIGAFNPEVRAASAVHPHSAHIRVARTAGITTALTRPEGGRISGQSAIIHLEGWTAPEMLVAEVYGLHLSVPSLPVHIPKDKKKQRQEEHKKELQQLEDFITSTKHYADVRRHAAADPQLDCEIDLALEAMVPYVRGLKPVVFTAHTYKEIVDCLAFARKHGLRCVLSGAKEAWKLADTLTERDIPVILGTPLSYPSNDFEPWDSVYRAAGVLNRAGVRFCFASERAATAYDLGIQAGMAVAHGLPRDWAEYALTLGAAEILGIADRVGSIEVGKRADLIVATDTPLQAVSQVTHMFIDGRPIELTSVHTELYEKFKNRPRPVLEPVPELNGPPDLTVR